MHRWTYCTSGHIAQAAILHRWSCCTGGHIAGGTSIGKSMDVCVHVCRHVSMRMVLACALTRVLTCGWTCVFTCVLAPVLTCVLTHAFGMCGSLWLVCVLTCCAQIFPKCVPMVCANLVPSLYVAVHPCAGAQEHQRPPHDMSSAQALKGNQCPSLALKAAPPSCQTNILHVGLLVLPLLPLYLLTKNSIA